MANKEKVLHIAITFDENYISPVYALLTSVYVNNQDHVIAVHAITSGVTPAQQVELNNYIAKYDGTICFYAIDKDFGINFRLPETLWWTTSIYYRLLFPQLLPASVHKFLYLDTDIIILQNLRELFATELSGRPIAAVQDKIVLRPELPMLHPESYFNSGVMLVDKTAWLAQNISAKAIEFIQNNAEKLVNPDQDALNAALLGNWVKLEKRFNLMFEEVPADLLRNNYAEFLRGIVVLHYTTQHKPWAMIGRNRLRYLYHHYLNSAPQKYRRYYSDFVWNRHKIREMLEIRIAEVGINRLIAKLLPSLNRK